MSKPASAIPASAATPRRRFPLERRPLFTALFAGNSVAELVRSARAAHWQGADAVCAELACLPREERTAEALRPFMTATPLPTMCCLYRNDRLGQDDDARQKDLLAALEAGAACIDVMGDLYDPSPREWTRKPSAIAKQKRLISKIHEAGAQVIVSAHLYAFVGPDEVLLRPRLASRSPSRSSTRATPSPCPRSPTSRVFSKTSGSNCLEKSPRSRRLWRHGLLPRPVPRRKRPRRRCRFA